MVRPSGVGVVTFEGSMKQTEPAVEAILSTRGSSNATYQHILTLRAMQSDIVVLGPWYDKDGTMSYPDPVHDLPEAVKDILQSKSIIKVTSE